MLKEKFFIPNTLLQQNHLKRGLYLEDQDTLIPWLTLIDNLINFAEPEIIAEAKKPSGLLYKTPYQYFIWKDHIWSGLIVISKHRYIMKLSPLRHGTTPIYFNISISIC